LQNSVCNEEEEEEEKMQQQRFLYEAEKVLPRASPKLPQ
jgi:hypothetical protein